MDLSKEYIEMCRKAEEIQKIKFSFISYDCPTCAGKNFYDDDETWLPRLDQLIEMINWDFLLCKTGEKYNVGWMHNEKGDDFTRHIYLRTSAEMILLEMIMMEKYNKRWNKEKGEWE